MENTTLLVYSQFKSIDRSTAPVPCIPNGFDFILLYYIHIFQKMAAVAVIPSCGGKGLFTHSDCKSESDFVSYC